MARIPTPGPIVILTGAGISKESGIRTFRDSGGLWENHRLEDVASPEGFDRDPLLVHGFYNARRRQLLSPEVAPNAAHAALAELENGWKHGPVLIVTQNVDDLHERAGSRRLLHMHGELLKARCTASGATFTWKTDLSTRTSCPCCGKAGLLRPDIVWFGEIPCFMDEIAEALSEASIFVSIGTSGQVYPAAGFVGLTRPGCLRTELNAEETQISPRFDEHRIGAASIEVPKLVRELLGATSPGG